MRSLKIDTWPQSHEKVESIETTLSKFAAYSCTSTFRGARPIHLVEQDPIHSVARPRILQGLGLGIPLGSRVLWAIPNQIDIAKQVKRAGDRKRKIEAHGGARRRTFKDIEAAKYDSSDGERE